MTSPANFTGRKRERQTSRRVALADKISHATITAGGLLTIVSISLVFIFLFIVVVPLFQSASIFGESSTSLNEHSVPVIAEVAEDHLLAWSLDQDGMLQSIALGDGRVFAKKALIDPVQVQAFNFDRFSNSLAIANADGTVQTATLSFRSASGASEGFVEQLPDGQQRTLYIAETVSEPIQVSTSGALVLLDTSSRPGGYTIAGLTAEGTVQFAFVGSKRNLLTGKSTTSVTSGTVAIPDIAEHGTPWRLFLSGLGDVAYLLWKDGHLVRIDARTVTAPQIVERRNTLGEGTGRELTAARFLIGKTSLVLGASDGSVGVWFPTKPVEATTADGITLSLGSEFNSQTSPVQDISPSLRSRLIAVGYQNGAIEIFHTTSRKLVASFEEPTKQPFSLVLSPKDSSLFALTQDHVSRWDFDVGHPAVSLSAMTMPVWYEGYAAPEHVWQSSSGTDSFEPKYGLVPLIFGTVKATLYSMLFAVPIALLAAIYTSEFLDPKTKRKVKPTIEMMASLPSVVLGFLAALVFAPIIEDIVPQVITGFFVIPYCLVLASYLWQLVPSQTRRATAHYRLLLVFLVLPLAVLISALLGPALESALFAGDIKAWLHGSVGSAFGGWFIVLLPLYSMILGWFCWKMLNPMLATRLQLSDSGNAYAELGKFLAATVIAVALTACTAWCLSSIGFDTRGGPFSTYVQRNALIVGFIMGFAIIPIIYTISDDALSSVPEHLRAASLGCGATRWQTALYIIIPTAMSGLFSAIMVGFGRAVGETMIVLMAAGNTPVLEWNIFDGFRTLSANIAVELPEAVQGGTHYRMLFLAALILFVMTFLVNTVAEVVRTKFRKRAYQL